HEWQSSRPVFFLLPACRSRGVPGYHLRMHQEIRAETAAEVSEEGQTARRASAWSSGRRGRCTVRARVPNRLQYDKSGGQGGNDREVDAASGMQPLGGNASRGGGVAAR